MKVNKSRSISIWSLPGNDVWGVALSGSPFSPILILRHLPTDAADVACHFLNGVKSGYQVAQANEA